MINSLSGLYSQQQNILDPTGSRVRFQSVWNNNGGARLGFEVESFLPVQNAATNFQAREMSNFAYIPAMQYLGQRGIHTLPYAFNFLRPSGIPTMSQLTGFGMGQPMGQFPGMQIGNHMPPALF